jgi:hypothetical protein
VSKFRCWRDAVKELSQPQAPYRCQFCGAPSWVEPSEQTMPPDYCHESDHGSATESATTVIEPNIDTRQTENSDSIEKAQ